MFYTDAIVIASASFIRLVVDGQVSTVGFVSDQDAFYDGSAVATDGSTISFSGNAAHLLLRVVEDGRCKPVGRGIGIQDGPVAEARFGKGCSIWPSARGSLVADKDNDAVRLIQDGTVTTVIDLLRRSSMVV